VFAAKTMFEGRGLHISAVAAVTLAAVGFFRGTDPAAPAAAFVPSSDARPVGEAPSYADLRKGQRGANARVHAGAIEALPGGDPSPRSTDERAQRRAFAGAPPFIPHAIDQRGGPYCLSCHDAGARIGAAVAPIMTHVRMDNCLQCHAPPAGRPLGGDPRPPAGSRFDGEGSWRRGPDGLAEKQGGE
jgi:nitrate reductase (cytochrome), electron transfer subunit